MPNTRTADSYRPSPSTLLKRPALDEQDPQPSKHIKRPSLHDLRALDSVKDLLKVGLPVCGARKKHQKGSSCDGMAECGACQGLLHVVCSCRYCELDREYLDATCTYVHSHQWDEEKEDGEWIVRDRRGSFISRKMTR